MSFVCKSSQSSCRRVLCWPKDWQLKFKSFKQSSATDFWPARVRKGRLVGAVRRTAQSCRRKWKCMSLSNHHVLFVLICAFTNSISCLGKKAASRSLELMRWPWYLVQPCKKYCRSALLMLRFTVTHAWMFPFCWRFCWCITGWAEAMPSAHPHPSNQSSLVEHGCARGIRTAAAGNSLVYRFWAERGFKTNAWQTTWQGKGNNLRTSQRENHSTQHGRQNLQRHIEPSRRCGRKLR